MGVLLMATAAPASSIPARQTASLTSGQTYRYPSAPVVQLGAEAAPRLVVEPPLADPLAYGRVVIQYHAENLRIRPVYGAAALSVSPRVGHIHVTVDGAPWHWADASDEPLIINGMKRGEHNVLIELADPTHRVVDSKLVKFIVPDLGGAAQR